MPGGSRRPEGGSAIGSGMSTAGATTRPGLTPMPVMTVGDAACTGLTSGDLLVDLTAVWSLDVHGRQPDVSPARTVSGVSGLGLPPGADGAR